MTAGGYVPGRLQVATDGRVTGPASISYNDPFPCVNGRFGVTGAMQGVVMHTMVCNLPQCIDLFNDPGVQASAHFGIAQDGRIHQFGPIGKGWMAWAQVAGNLAWYSIEHADNRNPNNPLTDAQIAASAQLVELLSRFAGFPLKVTDDVTGRVRGAQHGRRVVGRSHLPGHAAASRPVGAAPGDHRAGEADQEPADAEDLTVTGWQHPRARRPVAPLPGPS